MSTQQQYLRKISLIVANSKGVGKDLSTLRIKFNIKKNDAQTPNAAEITIYNLAQDTINQITQEFTQVVLQAGYDSNFGLIFSGNIKQTRVGKENGTDTFITLYAGDGDQAYNYSIVNGTLAPQKATQDNQILAALSPIYANDVTAGNISSIGTQTLPRGKVMYGMSRDYLRQSVDSANASWSIQDGQAQVITTTQVLPGPAVVLSSQTGLIGVPEQTTDGLSARCLLNPNLKIGSAVQISQADILTAPPADGTNTNTPTPPGLATDGFYRLFTVDHFGDSRGNDWYSDFVALAIDATQPADNQVVNNG